MNRHFLHYLNSYVITLQFWKLHKFNYNDVGNVTFEKWEISKDYYLCKTELNLTSAKEACTSASEI